MSEIIYEITKSSDQASRANLVHIQSLDRTLHYQIESDSLTIEIEFRPCRLEQINIGIMTSVKILIKGWYKGMDQKKTLITKTENINNMIKVVTYTSKQFQNVKFI
jgi:hypothetical protein